MKLILLLILPCLVASQGLGGSDTNKPGGSDFNPGPRNPGGSDTNRPGGSDFNSGSRNPGGSDFNPGSRNPGGSDTNRPGGSDNNSEEARAKGVSNSSKSLEKLQEPMIDAG